MTQITQMREQEQRDPETYAIIGAATEVHRTLGAGFLELVYHEALAVELSTRGIRYVRQVDLPVFYKRIRLRVHYRTDFIINARVIAELKALTTLTGSEEAQVISYLKASGLE